VVGHWSQFALGIEGVRMCRQRGGVRTNVMDSNFNLFVVVIGALVVLSGKLVTT